MAPPVWPSEKINYIAEHIKAVNATPREAAEYLCMAIAENKMTLDLMKPLLDCEDGVALRDVLLDVRACGYDNPTGDLPFRTALAEFYTAHLLKGCTEEERGKYRVPPEALMTVSGASAVMDVLLSVLTRPGDHVLIPAPHYAGYIEVVESVRLQTKIMPVHPVPQGGDAPREGSWPDLAANADDWIAPAALEASYARAERRASVLLLTSPTNPTGAVFSKAALQGAVAWARGHGIHTVVDEVYACEVHTPAASRPYLSTRVALDGALGEDVHVLWSVSKTFGVAGWRIGVLMTESARVRGLFGNHAHMCEASRCALAAFRHCIQQPRHGGVAGYLEAHVARLRETYGTVCRALTKHGIPYLPATAGLFVLLDLRAYARTPDEERALYYAFLEQQRVNLTPGFGALGCAPGWFRLCFAYNAPARTVGGVERVAQVLAAFPKTATPPAQAWAQASYHAQDVAQGKADWGRMPWEAIPSKPDLPPVFLDTLRGVAARGGAPKLLDIGCGDGRIGKKVQEMGFEVSGVDINADAVEHARGLGLDARVADCTAGLGGAAGFDAVLCQLVVSIIGPAPNRAALLKSAAAELRPGGLLLLSASGDSGAINEGYAALYAKDRPLTGEDRTYLSRDAEGRVLYTTHHFTREELAALCTAAGLDVVDVVEAQESSSRRPDQAAAFYYVVACRR
eukprot:TRINITY_DN20894_c0_g1_i1.p1 TRINITY_DN20894_c0_g1~~TRINITY_DN20894_c0_g1_i1.p1  ORF type:complete len:684 (+),score=263.52 TRINITY_DN20894_c0_g1_i1:58-2109(+)